MKDSAFKRLLRNKATTLFLIFLVLLFTTMILSSGVLDGAPLSALFTKGFMSNGNLRNIFYNLVIQCVMMCGISLVLISGNIDLSVGAQASIATMIFATLHNSSGLPWYICLIIVLLIAAVMGLINTFLVVKLGFPAFIATIGMSSIYSGLCNVITAGDNITLINSGFLKIGTTTAFNTIPLTFIFAAILMVVFQFIMSRTRFGRGIFVAGGNRTAARLAGLNPNRITLILFIVNSVLAALGGLLWVSQIGTASPTAIITAAPDMKVISASILGGVAFTGGSGNLGGPFIALLLLNVLDNMLTVIGVPSYWNVFAQGALLAIALILDYFSWKRRQKALLAG